MLRYCTDPEYTSNVSRCLGVDGQTVILYSMKLYLELYDGGMCNVKKMGEEHIGSLWENRRTWKT